MWLSLGLVLVLGLYQLADSTNGQISPENGEGVEVIAEDGNRLTRSLQTPLISFPTGDYTAQPSSTLQATQQEGGGIVVKPVGFVEGVIGFSVPSSDRTQQPTSTHQPTSTIQPTVTPKIVNDSLVETKANIFFPINTDKLPSNTVNGAATIDTATAPLTSTDISTPPIQTAPTISPTITPTIAPTPSPILVKNEGKLKNQVGMGVGVPIKKGDNKKGNDKGVSKEKSPGEGKKTGDKKDKGAIKEKNPVAPGAPPKSLDKNNVKDEDKDKDKKGAPSLPGDKKKKLPTKAPLGKSAGKGNPPPPTLAHTHRTHP